VRRHELSFLQHGVQGVASSNPAAPTNEIKYLDEAALSGFFFLRGLVRKIPAATYPAIRVRHFHSPIAVIIFHILFNIPR
jgi:hypothetical protein